MIRFPFTAGLLSSLVFILSAPTPIQADPLLRDQLLPRTAFLVRPNPAGSGMFIGAGVLIDVKKRWLLTAAHVVGTDPQIDVYFPCKNTQGEVITDASYYYAWNKHRLCIRGRVVLADAVRDLAVVELEKLPDGVQPITLATQSPKPGDPIYVIGNSRVGRALWCYSEGYVRTVYYMRWRMKGACLCEAQVVENQIPINHGDSGGPVVNARGELIGIVSCGLDHDIGLAYAIDISEIHRFLQEVERPPLSQRRPALPGGTWIAVLEDGSLLSIEFKTNGTCVLRVHSDQGRLREETVFHYEHCRDMLAFGAKQPGQPLVMRWLSEDEFRLEFPTGSDWHLARMTP
jgi:S1-C subfamily serine protease